MSQHQPFGASVKINGTDEHEHVGQVGVVKPLADAKPGHKYHGAYEDPPHPDHHIFHSFGIMIPAVIIYTEAEDHYQEAVGGMDLYIQEVERAEGQHHKDHELNNIKYGEEPEHSRTQFAGGEVDHDPLQQVDGDHTQQPARQLPEKAHRVEKPVPDNAAQQRGDAHQQEVKQDLPVHPAAVIKRLQLPGADEAGDSYQHIRGGSYRLIDSYSERKDGGLHEYI